MSWMDHIKGKRTTDDPIPGTGKQSDKLCPLYNKPLFLKYKCCGQPYDMLVCNPCGYKEVIS